MLITLRSNFLSLRCAREFQIAADTRATDDCTSHAIAIALSLATAQRGIHFESVIRARAARAASAARR
jgi:hypothetical protein